MIERAGVLIALCRDYEAQLLAGEKLEVPLYLASVNALGRTLERLGVSRRARDVTSLADYLDGKAKTRAAEVEEITS
jgi:hypothetical protein